MEDIYCTRARGPGATHVHGRRDQDPLPPAVDAPVGVPRAHDARQEVVAYAADDLGQGVRAQGHDGHEVGPAAQLDVQDGPAAAPDALLRADGRPAAPLVAVVVNAVQPWDLEQGPQVGLLCGLAGEEVGCRGGQYQPDGERRWRVGLGQRGYDVGDLDCCYGAGGREEKVGLAVVSGGCELGQSVGWRGAGGCWYCVCHGWECAVANDSLTLRDFRS